MITLTDKQKAKIASEIEKLSTQGLGLLNLFHKEMDDSSSILYKLAKENSCLAIVYICRGWMLAQGASKTDIHHAGNVVNFTGVWGRWSVMD